MWSDHPFFMLACLVLMASAISHLLDIGFKSIRILSGKSTEKSNIKPAISVVVCAHNELENLQRLIPHLLKQRYEDFEIIMVNDRSTDGSKAYLEEISAKQPLLNVINIREQPPNTNPKKMALTQAIAKARNEWILVTDADCHPVSHLWLASMASKMEPEVEIVLGVSPYIQESTFLSRVIQYETLVTAIHFIGSALSKRAYMGLGRNMAYKKSTFVRCGGFKDLEWITGGDDDLLVQRMASRHNVGVATHQDSLTYSQPKRTWRGYLAQKTRHLSVGKYYKQRVKEKHLVRSLTHILLWLSFTFLLTFNLYSWAIIGIFAIVILIKGLFLKQTASKFGMGFSWSGLLFLDLFYALALPLVGMRSVMLKRVKWS